MSKREDENCLLTFAKSLPAKDDSTIRVFQRGEKDKYEWSCIDEDAEISAQIVYRTPSALRQIGTTQSKMCSMNTTLFRNFLTEALQHRGLRLQIYEQDTGRYKWKNYPREASPGNLQAVEDLIGSNTDQIPIVVAVQTSSVSTGGRKVGVCYVDAESRRIGLSEFVDNDLFSNLESLLIQLGAKELLLSEGKSAESKQIVEMVSRLDILVTYRKPAQFSSRDVGTDLVRLTGLTDLELQEQLNMETALCSVGAALKFLGLMSQSNNFGKFCIDKHDLDQYMKLDAAALRALNIMPTVRDGTKTMCLFGLLNQCKTTAGSRLLAQWLKQPLMDPSEISNRHDLVSELIENTVLRNRLQEDLMHAVPDLCKIIRKFHTQKAKLEDVIRIYHLAIKLPEFVEEIQNAENDKLMDTYGVPLLSAQNDLAKLVELVESTVDLEALNRHEYIVKSDFDENLGALKEERAEIMNKMQEELDRVCAQLDSDRVKLEDNPNHGWTFRLTRTEAGVLRDKPGFIDLKTQKAGQIFTTKILRDLDAKHQELGEQYSKAQSSVAREVVNISSTYLSVLGPLAYSLAHLDVILSFAHVSTFAKLPYVRPKFGNALHLTQARHPCMEVQNDMMFIPNDVHLTHDKSEFAIVTGPNMGGKSTYIRQIGVICHMAQIGCFVPCEDAELTIIDSILARVGAGDSQLKGISTFMAEMLEISSILKTATPRSLIIIDELGRGTSTYDGFGLAWAISQHIVEEIGCWCVFATHFHELTALSNKYKNVTNLHVKATSDEKDDDITLLYKVEPGISGKSFGIHVAEVVHFPEKVVNMAKRRVSELEDLDQVNSTNEEVVQGRRLLNDVLHKWASETQPHESKESKTKRLRSAIGDNKEIFESNSYLRQILTSL